MHFVTFYFKLSLLSQTIYLCWFSDINLSSIINILSLPTASEQDQAVANFSWNRQKIISSVLDYNIYSDYEAPEKGVKVSVLLYIDKLTKLNETEQSVNFHGSFLFSWKDERLQWKPRDYGGVEAVDIYQIDAGRIWMPQIRLLNIQNFYQDIITPYSTSFTIRRDGRVFGITKIALKVYCNFYLSNYPYDFQLCTMRLYSPKRFTSQVDFENNPLIWEQYNGRVRKITKLETTGYALVFANATRKATSIYRPPNILSNTTDPKMTQSFIDYNFKFKRTENLYGLIFMWPMTCTIIFTHVAASFNSTLHSVIWLMASLCFQYLNSSRLLKIIPPQHDEVPFCLTFSRFMIIETVVLFFCRILLNIFEVKSKLNEKLQRKGQKREIMTIEILQNVEGGDMIIEKTNEVVDYLQNNYHLPKRCFQIFLVFYTIIILYYLHTKHNR
uniref:Neur_chan_LBD domain-containing protein n=1 Tax=Strongyloides papillosus TaxID=174720 RepID=A0A0N5C1G0_STREA